MECRAEINRFAMFLLCLLVPLGSTAPTQTSEAKVTAGPDPFIEEKLTHANIIQENAHELFQSYNNYISAALHPDPCLVPSKGRDLVERIPICEAFEANCCALHHIQNILKTLEGDIETISHNSSTGVLRENLSQLNITLGDSTVFSYTCQDLPQTQPVGKKDKKIYIWWVLRKYKYIAEFTARQICEKAAAQKKVTPEFCDARMKK